MFTGNIFVDTSGWVALADKNDFHHKAASRAFSEILKEHKLITSNLIVAETYIIFLKELGHKPAFDFLENIKASPRIFKIYSNDDIETDAEEILKKYEDQNFSFTDAVSFTIMKREKLEKAFSFDKHFLTAGFVNVP